MMGLSAVRVLDWVNSTCYPTRQSGPVYRGSMTTFVNNRGMARQGDETVPGPILGGAKTRLCENKPIARLKDSVFCGIIASASPDTFIDD